MAGRPEDGYCGQVADGKLRIIVERDLEELHKAEMASALKSRLILSGGLIEGFLLDALLSVEATALAAKKADIDRTSGKAKPLDEWNLSNLIEVAFELGLVTKDTHSLSNSIREYRNLVHPGLERRSGRGVRDEIAKIAEQVLNMVRNDLARKPGP